MKALQKVWSDEVKRPFKVMIALTNVAPADQTSGNLFDDPQPPAGLDHALDALARRYGPGTVTTGAALAAVPFLNHQRISFGAPKTFEGL